jgi:predicted nucleotidyltransferase
VVSASLFGSVARDEAGIDSDVDVVVKLSDSFSTGGFDYFWQLERLENHHDVKQSVRLASLSNCITRAVMCV